MSRAIQIRRGTAAEHDNFTGLEGEVTYDTTNKTLRVHDGVTVGGNIVGAGGALSEDIDSVVAWQTPNADNNYTWYRKYKSGWVEQGGHLETYPASEESTVVFPVEFMDTNFYTTRVLEYGNKTTDWVVYCGAVIYNKSTKQMTFRHKGPVSWFACGLSNL